jgi:hypothetical protein
MNRIEPFWAVFLSDTQIKLTSGHESKKSLKVYQHLFPDAVEDACRGAVQDIGVVTGYLGYRPDPCKIML